MYGVGKSGILLLIAIYSLSHAFAHPAFSAQPNTADPISLLERVLAHRDAITHAQLKLAVRSSTGGGTPSGAALREVEFVWKPFHTRVIVNQSKHGIDHETWQHSFNDRVVLNPEEFIHHTSDVGPNGDRAAATLVRRELDESGLALAGQGVHLFDPRLLGVRNQPFSALPHDEWSSIRAAILVHPWEKVVPDSAESTEELITLRTVAETGAELNITIDAARESIVRSTASIELRGSKLLDTMVVTLKEYPLADEKAVWFPQRIDWSRQIDGQVGVHEEIEVVSADFVTPPPEDEFSLAGLDVPSGTIVLEEPPHKGGTRQWDGKELVPLVQRSSVPGGNLANADAGRMRRVLILMAVNLAVAAGFFFWWAVSRRSRPD